MKPDGCALVMGAGDIDTLKLDLLDALALRFPSRG
jgi:hypothetical protein